LETYKDGKNQEKGKDKKKELVYISVQLLDMPADHGQPTKPGLPENS